MIQFQNDQKPAFATNKSQAILFRHCYEKKESIKESKKDVNELISTLSDIFLCDFVDLVESRNY